jgi:small-conductance mechanosensitive channel
MEPMAASVCITQGIPWTTRFPELLRLAVDADFWNNARSLLMSGIILGSAVALALAVHFIFFNALARLAHRRGRSEEYAFVRRGKKPARFMFPLIALSLALPFTKIPGEARNTVAHILGLCVIASIGWAVVALVELASDIVSQRYVVDSPDNLTARRVRTQTQVLQRIFILVVTVVTASVMLMTFPEVRHIGMSLLASAGLAGLIVGMAARSTLSNLIAGLQVALSQPIRIDDAVVVEGEWGWIEEINMTYVVVRVWDLRRLVVPLSYFIEKPFQNWTRTHADLLGAVLFYVDYSAPIEEMRKELRRILESSNLWDGKTCVLQVTDVTEKTMQVRALMSARNGPAAFDLRCLVREKLIQFLQEQHPASLPTARELQLAAHQNLPVHHASR